MNYGNNGSGLMPLQDQPGKHFHRIQSDNKFWQYNAFYCFMNYQMQISPLQHHEGIQTRTPWKVK